MSVRAKFKVEEITFTKEGGRIILLPVTDGSPENEEFFKWTPYGEIKIGTINPAVLEEFKAGDAVYVDFTKVSSDGSHQDRVKDEKHELDKKLKNLNVFLSTELFNKLNQDEQSRLREQFKLMTLYSKTLEDRISAFT